MALVALSACGAESDAGTEPITTPDPNAATPGASACVVSLHGKGGDGTDSFVVDDIVYVAPRGNDEAWGAWQWDYTDAAENEADAIEIVAESVDAAGCATVAIHGFSNGASFAARLYCSGETFDGRVVGIVIDDPVADTATAECAPDPSVEATLYWTGALASDAPAGTDCTEIDWTCLDDEVIGIDAFAAAADLAITTSPFTDHRRFDDAPDPLAWLTTA